MLEEGIGLHDIGRRLDADHALMGKALQLLTGNVNERFTVTLELLRRTIAQVDWPAIRTGNRDAYLHLYEHFLTIYDPVLRQRSGSYYTPHEVVQEMVRLTEDVLRTRLGQSDHFRSDGVRIVDPAMGTGTFLHTIIERAAEQAAEGSGPAMSADAISRLAPRLYGFEMQMGPFAVAELRASELLKRYKTPLPEGGLNLFVTDTLDNPFVEEEYLASTYEALSESRRRANNVKANVPVTVVIANPPYDDKAEDLGGWVEKRTGRDEVPLLDAFRYPGNGRYEHVLKNMYVYFWRWATWKVFDATTVNATAWSALSRLQAGQLVLAVAACGSICAALATRAGSSTCRRRDTAPTFHAALPGRRAATGDLHIRSQGGSRAGRGPPGEGALPGACRPPGGQVLPVARGADR